MLRDRLKDALREAMKEQDKRAVSTVRLVLAALKDRDIAARGRGQSDGLEDDDILALLQKMVKQRRESIELYEKAGRDDLVLQEREEIAVISRFLPQLMDEQATAAAVDAAMSELKADSIKDMGRVMAALKERFPGKMDFAKASGMVKERLA
ncbi:MAG: GatB/YqeY domain-containing protein [Rhodospirillales bacterium]